MRIAILNWSFRKEGGAEAYLNRIIQPLAVKGFKLSLWAEVDNPKAKKRIEIPEGIPFWCAEYMGFKKSFDELKKWGPDVIYSQGLQNPAIDEIASQIAPVVLFAHNYYGTCVSGAKTHRTPIIVPCKKTFGAQCLFHYYPRRCGGLNPVTMMQQYAKQKRRALAISYYRTILTASEHMKAEYVKHGYSPEIIQKIHLPIYQKQNVDAASIWDYQDRIRESQNRYRILFMGRMDGLKGVRFLMRALPGVYLKLQKNLEVTIVGDGTVRKKLEVLAKEIMKHQPKIHITFPGWLEEAGIKQQLKMAHVLVAPSVWPEPFGMVGPEAGLFNVPAVGFSVGGIPEWLHDGVNGHLAIGEIPSPDRLGDAIVKTLADRDHYIKLCDGARIVAERFSLEQHIDKLSEIFHKTVLSQQAKNQKAVRPYRFLMASNIQNVTYTGMGRWSYRVADRINASGHNVTMWFQEMFPLVNKFKKISFLLFPLVLALRILIKHRSFDAVVIHEPSGMWYGMLRKIFRFLPPMIVMCHNVESHSTRSMLAAAERGYARLTLGMITRFTKIRIWQSNTSIRLADHVICLSNSDKNYILNELRKKENHVSQVLNGVDRQDFIEPARKIGRKVLFIGGWLDIKGAQILPKVWKLLRTRVPGAELVIVGSGIASDKVTELFEAEDRMSITVYPLITDDAQLKAMYQLSDVLFMPSISEGCPLTMLEAMAAGVPIVASKVGGNQDVISNGEEGYLYDCWDIQKAADLIESILTNPDKAKKLGEKGVQRVKTLKWSSFSQEITAVTDRLMSENANL